MADLSVNPDRPEALLPSVAQSASNIPSPATAAQAGGNPADPDPVKAAQAQLALAVSALQDLKRRYDAADDDMKGVMQADLTKAMTRASDAEDKVRKAQASANTATNKDAATASAANQKDASADYLDAHTAEKQAQVAFMKAHGGLTPEQVQAKVLQQTSAMKDAGLLTLDQAKAVISQNHDIIGQQLAALGVGQSYDANQTNLYGHDLNAQTSMRNADLSAATSLADAGIRAGQQATTMMHPGGWQENMDAIASGHPERQRPETPITLDVYRNVVSQIADMAVQKAMGILGAQPGQSLGEAATARTGFKVMDHPMPVFTKEDIQAVQNRAAAQQGILAPPSAQALAAMQSNGDPAAIAAAQQAAADATLTPGAVGFTAPGGSDRNSAS